MNIVVTGSLGHISKPLAEKLVKEEHTVTVISRSAERQPAIEELGARPAIGSLDDAAFLTSVFEGADAVYCMIPPNFGEPDQIAYYRRIGQSYQQALRQSGVRRVVHLSSWGAHRSEGTGIILGSHNVENMLNELPGIALTHLRAGSIYYNLYSFVDMIKQAGIIGSNYGGDDKVVWAAPEDIAAAAAEELTTPHGAARVRYVASDERTASETAQTLGEAIGKPDLQWATFSDEQVRESLRQRGMPARIVDDLVALNASIHSGVMGEDYEKNKPATMGQVKVEDFAQDFEKAFHHQQ